MFKRMSDQLPSDEDHPYEPNSPEEILFNENMREFAVKVSHICGLEANGKIPQAEAYKRVRELWQQLKRSKKNLGIGKQPDTDQTQ